MVPLIQCVLFADHLSAAINRNSYIARENVLVVPLTGRQGIAYFINGSDLAARNFRLNCVNHIFPGEPIFFGPQMLEVRLQLLGSELMGTLYFVLHHVNQDSMRLPLADQFDVTFQNDVHMFWLIALVEQHIVAHVLHFLIERQDFLELVSRQVLVNRQLLQKLSLLLLILQLDLLEHLIKVVFGQRRQLACRRGPDACRPLLVIDQSALSECLSFSHGTGLREPFDCLESPNGGQVLLLLLRKFQLRLIVILVVRLKPLELRGSTIILRSVLLGVADTRHSSLPLRHFHLLS